MRFAFAIFKSSFMICHRHCFCIPFVIFSLLPFSSLLAQVLTLEDVLQIDSLDSTSARQYCTGKQLPLVTSGNTGATRRYQFCTPDSSNRLEINYPNDHSSPNIQINYWFTGEGQYKNMQEDFIKLGFHRQSAQETGSVPFNAERYIAKNLQAELIRQQGKQSFWLFLHSVGHYSE